MTPSTNCANLIKSSEGLLLTAYPDPASGGHPWTIGYGSTGPDIHRGLIWTKAQADARLAADLATFGAAVAALIGDAKTTQHQFDAMTSFAYNLGVDRLKKSTLLKDHKAGLFTAAQGQFQLYTKAGETVLKGLVKRRAAEAALYGRRA